MFAVHLARSGKINDLQVAFSCWVITPGYRG